MERLLYVSESRIDPLDLDSCVSQIVAVAQIRNAGLALTGALLFTGTHFAQILEGSTESIAQLMSSLHDDPRHANIVVVDRLPVEVRQFPDWQMAYFGPSQFVSRHVVRLLNQTTRSERQRATEWLTQLAHEFSTAGPYKSAND